MLFQGNVKMQEFLLGERTENDLIIQILRCEARINSKIHFQYNLK